MITFKVDNGRPGLVIFGDLPQYPECGYLALYVVGLQQIDEKVQPIGVTDGQLTRLLAKVKVQDRAQGNNCCSLVSTLSNHHNIHTHQSCTCTCMCKPGINTELSINLRDGDITMLPTLLFLCATQKISIHLQVLDQLLNLPIFTGQVSIGLLSDREYTKL